jgi:hypothetical protein
MLDALLDAPRRDRRCRCAATAAGRAVIPAIRRYVISADAVVIALDRCVGRVAAASAGRALRQLSVRLSTRHASSERAGALRALGCSARRNGNFAKARHNIIAQAAHGATGGGTVYTAPAVP